MTTEATTETRMSLRDYPFPDVRDIDRAFPTLAVPDDLLAEAKARGFDKNRPYTALFRAIFYDGRTPQPRADLTDDDAEWMAKVWAYLQVLMASFASKHEHKEAVSAMLLSEIAAPEPAAMGEDA